MRKPKKYFFEAPDTKEGKKFCKHNEPTKEIFQALFDSLPFVADAQDSAKEREAGHVRIVTDADGIARTVTFKDKHSHAVLPHQLPLMVTGEGETQAEVTGDAKTFNGVTITPVEITLEGGKKRLSYKVEVAPELSLAVSATGKLVLTNDMSDANKVLPANQDKFYGVHGSERGFFRVLPTYAVGALKCRLNGEVYELYFDADSSVSGGGSKRLYSAYSELALPAVPETPVLRGFQLTDTEFALNNVLRFKAVLYVGKNNGNTKVYARIGMSSGSLCATHVIEHTDGNQDGYITLEGEIAFIGEDIPDTMVFDGKAYNSAIPTEMVINHREQYSFAGDATHPLLEICAERVSGNAEVKLYKFLTEIIK